MAVVEPTFVSDTPKVWGNNSVFHTWANLATGDTGAPIQGSGFTDRSFQIGGTFGGSTVVIEGSNDGTTYATLKDPFGNSLSFTAAGFAQVIEIARYMRPRVSGGAAASITVVSTSCNHMYN